TSAGIAIAVPPLAAIASAVPESWSALRETRAILTPRLARRMAANRPIPRPAPVTRATFPFNPGMPHFLARFRQAILASKWSVHYESASRSRRVDCRGTKSPHRWGASPALSGICAKIRQVRGKLEALQVPKRPVSAHHQNRHRTVRQDFRRLAAEHQFSEAST